MSLIQYKKGSLYIGFDSVTGQAKAYPSIAELKKDFPKGIDPSAQEVPANIDVNSLTSKPNSWVTLFSVGPSNPTTPAQTTPVNTGSSTVPTVDVPQDLANDPFFKQLNDENKSIIAYYWKTLSGQNTNSVAAFEEAMNLASQQADPYWKEKARIIKDELTRVLQGTNEDLVSQEQLLARRKKELLDDLTYNKDQLTTEQAAELARQADKYEAELDATREKMAERGLSSSSIRTQAEERLDTENADIIESTERKYARELRSQEVTSGRKILDYDQQIGDLRRTAQDQKKAAVRKAESALGTTEVETLSGASEFTSKNITGSMATDKSNDILTRAKALLTKNNPNLNI